MAALNLVPDPVVVSVQAVIFLSNMYVIKKLMLEPYLELKAKRDRATIGSQDTAEKLALESKNMTDQIEARLKQALNEAKDLRSKLVDEANQSRSAITKSAEEDARKVIEKAQHEIRAEVESERRKLPEIIKALTADVLQKAVN